jgi:hypothetical protein
MKWRILRFNRKQFIWSKRISKEQRNDHEQVEKWLVVCAAAIAAHGVWGLTLGGHNRDWWSASCLTATPCL